MRSNFHKYFLILTGVFLLFFIACNHNFQEKIPPKAIKGILDLTDWNFKSDGAVELSGEYEFYWKQQLAPSDFTGATPPQKTGFIQLPGFWNGYEINGKELHGDGYATYRLKILLHEKEEHLALKLLSIGTAYTLFLNDQKVSSIGIAGKDRETTVPRYFPQIIDCKVEASQIELIFQVSNFHHRRGGPREVIQLGEEKGIQKIKENRLGFDLFLFGSIFIMALYHFCLFTLKKKERTFLYFSIFCFLVTLRLLATGEKYIIHFFPNIPWELLVKMEYLSFYLAIPAFVLFIQAFFPQEIPRRILHLIVSIGLAFSCAVLFTPARIFSYTLQIYQILTIIIIIYGLYVLIVASIRKRAGAFIFLLGFIILAFSAINDMMYAEAIIQTGYFAPLGLCIFIFFQAFLLSLRLTKAFEYSEIQYKELKETYRAYREEIIDRVQAEEALYESDKKYRTILNNMEDGYWEVDLSGNLTFINPALCRHLGYSQEESIGMNNRQFMTEVTAEKVFQTFNEVYRTGKPALAYDWETITKDGTKKFIETSISLLYDSKGEPIGFRGVGRDITERKRAQEQERLHQEQLFQASKMVALGTLVSGVAHEINNPNNFIRLNTPTLQEAWESALPILEEYYTENGDFMIGGMKYTEMREKIPVLFSGILNGSKRIMQIVENLKNFVRKDVSEAEQSVDINAVLQSAISLISNMINKSTHHFSVEYGKDLPSLTGNFQRLEQVFVNLIQNACQALKEPTKGIFVSISCDEEMNSIVVKIRDEGTGILPENLSQITDPFFSTKHDLGGVGLGLSISSKIVEDHGGRMIFDSEIGKGTTVEIILPVHEKNNTLKGIIE
jgi:PAS domain S-box-containing protein